MKNFSNTKSLVPLLACALFAMSFVFGCSPSGDSGADIVMTGGVVYTVEGTDWDNAPAQALAIKDGKIVFVGSDADAAGLITSKTKVIDLEGKTVLPSFGDSHVHPPGTALSQMYEIYLYEALTKEKTLAVISEFIAAHPGLDAYWGAGVSMGIGGEDAEGRGPRKEWLDEICPDKPVLIRSNDGHSYWLNSKALEMNSITRETVHPTGSVQKGPDGELWGTLTDAGSLLSMSQTYSEAQVKEAMLSFQGTMHAWGYTYGAMIPSASYADYLVALGQTAEWKMTCALTMRITPTRLPMDKTFEEQLEKVLSTREKLKDDDNMTVVAVKFFEDGVVEGMTAYLSSPYDAAAGLEKDYAGYPLWSQEELNADFARLLENGISIHVHSIGDEATSQVINAMQYAQGLYPGYDARNTITHLQVVKDSDKARMGELGIIGSTQPYWHLKEPEWYEYVDSVALGKDRAYAEYPVKSLIDAGVRVTFSGDYPVSPINNPFWAMETSVTRNLNNADFYGVDDITGMDDPKWLLNPAERISVRQAVESYTINVAYQMHADDRLGSIAAGKYADIIIIDQDIFKVNPIDIDRTKVLYTYYRGQLVYGE